MLARPDPIELKRSALAMVASGNAVDAVASLLRVSADTVGEWIREGPDASEPRPSIAPSTPDRRPVETTGFVALKPVERGLLIGLPPVTAVFFMASGLPAGLAEAGLGWVCGIMLLVGLPLGVWCVASGLRNGFELTRHGVRTRSALGTRFVAYADFASYRIVYRVSASDDYEILLQPTQGRREMAIWLMPWQVQQPGTADWLAGLPCTRWSVASNGNDSSPGDVRGDWAALLVSHRDGFAADRHPVVVQTELERDVEAFALTGAFWVSCVIAVVFCFCGSALIYSALQGPPPREVLRVTQGRVVGWTPCMRPGHGRRHQMLDVDTGARVVGIEIPCLLSDGIIEQSRTAHVLIRSEAFLSVQRIYEVVYDGAVLRSYEDFAANSRRGAPSGVAGGLFMIAAAIGMVRFAARARNGGDEE